MNPACPVTAPVPLGVLCNINCRAAIFAAKREPLKKPEPDQDYRGSHADGAIARQDAYCEGGQAHDEDCDKKGIFAPDQVAEAAEEDCAERPDEKSCREREEREDKLPNSVKRLGQARKEVRADDGRERPVEVEVVPLENRAER